MSDIIKLGDGVILFKSSIKVNKKIISFIDNLKDDAKKNHYTFIKDSDGKDLYAVNKSGHRFNLEDIDKNCSRITDFYNHFDSEDTKNFFINCEKTIYKTLLSYASIYPMIIPCLWWKTTGHILAYGPNSDLGLHCDNDVNYQPGFEPDFQLGTRHVLAAITYFNSSVKEYNSENFVGGEIYFPYLDITYTPESGDILMFPANFVASHQVLPVSQGNRYAYLEYFGQGSSQEDRGICIAEDNENIFGGQVWMSSLHKDYTQYIFDEYGENYDLPYLLPVGRKYNSHNTKLEVNN